MFRFGPSLSHLERHVGNFSVEALASVIPPTSIGEVLRERDRASQRIRALPADLVVWLLVAMGLWRGSGIRNVLVRLAAGLRGRVMWKAGKVPPSNVITKARDRLGLAPLVCLFRRLASTLWQTHAELHCWKGMPLLAVDGTTLKMPDSKSNRRRFGAPGASRGRSAFPQIRVVALMAAVTHVVLAVVTGPYSTGEGPLAASLLTQLRAGCLLLLDRGFLNYGLLFDLRAGECDFVVRAKRGLRLRRRASLGPWDYLADALLPRPLRRRRPHLPPSLRVRVISYRVKGFRPVRLLTSLLDETAFPAAEIVARYRERWEIEIGYDEIKTHLLGTPVPLRSTRAKRVLQEVYGILLAYNAVRVLIAEAAARTGQAPRRISFTDVLERLRDLATRMAVTPGRDLPALFDAFLLDAALCTLPPRRMRRYPRAVRVKMSSYPLKRGPARAA